jgi:lycopene beta-cyclase
LLNVMQKRRCEAKEIFTALFKRNQPATVLKFLDEATTLPEDLQILTSVPSLPFMAAAFDIARKRLLEMMNQ